MRYEFSPMWHRIGKFATWRMYDNTLPYRVNRRYIRYGRSRCGNSTSWPLRNEGPVIVRGAMTNAIATRCSDAISDGLASGALHRSDDVPFLVTVPRPLDLFGMEMLEAFDGALGQRLRLLYGSE